MTREKPITREDPMTTENPMTRETLYVPVKPYYTYSSI